MIDKIKKIFNNKEKRIENLFFLLIVLVITLIVINKILDKEETVDYENQVGVELASSYEQTEKDNLENKLENILSKIDGVGTVSVLITYSESKSYVPIYNVNSSQSKIEENDTSGVTKTTETINEEKEVIKDASSNIITEKVVMPKIEGAIIIAKGASDATVKGNIISAVEAVTGIATHKIQVYEMGDK